MNIAIVGATGLIGNEVLSKAIEDKRINEILLFQRKPSKQQSPKITEFIVSLDELEKVEVQKKVDVFICALGTTIKKVKTKEAFRKVDFDFVLNAAKLAKKNNCKHFIVVSAIGSNKNSKVFYSKVKGEMEESLKALAFDSLDILQPSFLQGNREEFRFGERLALVFVSVLNPFMIGPLRPYAGIKAETMAQAILFLAFKSQSAVNVHTKSSIEKNAKYYSVIERP